ncbi:DNA polymerase III subunit delta [Patescibacteria group bacterium]|nr:DNA polymerase III subunit delta [Patescibacteria group bacterium]MCG2687932.1 DNA polymerase III subunit delta [Candidatus Parcubacteria bacterium]
MLIFIFGEDTFSTKKQVQAMREKFLEKFDPLGTNLAVFDTQDSSFAFGDVARAMSTPPFLSPKRMVILKNLLLKLKKADEKLWIEQLGRIPESTIVIIVEDMEAEKAKKQAIVKASAGFADVHFYEHDILSKSQAIKWAIDYANEKSLQLDAKLVADIVQSAGTDLWILSSQLDKLAGYCKGRVVTMTDVQLLVFSTADDQLFTCIDAIFQSDNKKAVELIRQQRQFGTPDGQIFSMLLRQIRLLIAYFSLHVEYPNCTKQDVAKELGVHPFVAQKLIAQADRFSLDQMIDLQNRLFQAEKYIKTSILDHGQAVDDLITRLV